MITKLNVAVAAAALVIGFAGAAKAGEGSVDSNNFGNTYYGWNQPSGGWGTSGGYVAPGYSYAPRSYYYGDDADLMTGYTVRRPMVEPYGYDDDEE